MRGRREAGEYDQDPPESGHGGIGYGEDFFGFLEQKHSCRVDDSGGYGAETSAETCAEVDFLSAVGNGGSQTGMSLYHGKYIQSDTE